MTMTIKNMYKTGDHYMPLDPHRMDNGINTGPDWIASAADSCPQLGMQAGAAEDKPRDAAVYMGKG